MILKKIIFSISLVAVVASCSNTTDIPLTGKVSPVEKSVVDVPVAKKVVSGVRADKVFAHFNKTGFSLKGLRGFTKCEELGPGDFLPGNDWFGSYNCDNDGTKNYTCTNLTGFGPIFGIPDCHW